MTPPPQPPLSPAPNSGAHAILPPPKSSCCFPLLCMPTYIFMVEVSIHVPHFPLLSLSCFTFHCSSFISWHPFSPFPIVIIWKLLPIYQSHPIPSLPVSQASHGCVPPSLLCPSFLPCSITLKDPEQNNCPFPAWPTEFLHPKISLSVGWSPELGTFWYKT